MHSGWNKCYWYSHHENASCTRIPQHIMPVSYTHLKLSVEYTYETFSFPDGEAYTLCKPNYTISEWYAEEIKPEDLFCTVRIPLRHVGMGQMMALDPVEIEALAAKSNYPEYLSLIHI